MAGRTPRLVVAQFSRRLEQLGKGGADNRLTLVGRLLRFVALTR